ncbi:MAG: DUF3592 domain-containing protein [Acidimicrobiales bacterium]|nr:DUF3592 domain-containing protein [Acidimicrobiales bacterium]
MEPFAAEDIIVFLTRSPLLLLLLLVFREGRRLRYLGRPLFRSWRNPGIVSEHIPSKLSDGTIKPSAVITFTSEWGSTVRYVEPPLRRGQPPSVGTEVKMCHRFGDETTAKRYDRSRQIIGWLTMITSGPLLIVLFLDYWPLLAIGGAALLANAIRRRATGRTSSTVCSAFREEGGASPVPQPVAPTIDHDHASGTLTRNEFSATAYNGSKHEPSPDTAPPPPQIATGRPKGWKFAGLDSNTYKSNPTTKRYPADETEVARVKALTASLKPAVRNYALTMVLLAVLGGAVQGPFPGPPFTLLFLLVGFFILWQAQPFPDGVITTGHVVDHVARSGSKGGTVYANTIEFETDDGPVRFTTSTASSKRTAIGTERTVSYRPYDLNQARCINGLGAWMGWVWTVFSALIGMVFNWMVWPPLLIVAGIGAWILHRRYVQLLRRNPATSSISRSPLIS